MVSELVPGGDGSQHPSHSWVFGGGGGGRGAWASVRSEVSCEEKQEKAISTLTGVVFRRIS